MSGLADLNRFLGSSGFDALANFPESKTIGATWRWSFAGFVDAVGTPIDFTASGVTATCQILAGIGGAVLATPTFAPGIGGFEIDVAASVTAALTPQRGVWFLQISNSAGEDVPFWGVTGSPFTILAKE